MALSAVGSRRADGCSSTAARSPCADPATATAAPSWRPRASRRGRAAAAALPLGHRADRHAVAAAHRVPHAPTGRKVHFVSRVFLLRHGETEWSRSGQHTGPHRHPPHRPGTRCSPRPPAASGATSSGDSPFAVWCSPRSRARDTAELAGLAVDRIDDRLVEWDYGDYEGITTEEIRETVPGWTVWTHPCPHGETAERRRGAAPTPCSPTRGAADTDVVLVGHGHFSRVLVSRWLAPPGRRRRALRDGRRGLGRARRRAGRAADRRAQLPSPGVIRTATEDDVPAIVAMVHELAEYERAPEECHLTEGQLTTALFGPAPALFGHVAFVDDTDGRARGLRAVVPELLDLARRARDLPRGPLRAPALPGPRPRPCAARAAGGRVRRARVRRGWSGRCWTGTTPPSASTARSAPRRWTSGRPSASTARRSRLSGVRRRRPLPGPLADEQQERHHDVNARRDAEHDLSRRPDQRVDDRQQ